MPKQVFRICFFVFFLLSLIHISYSNSEENQTISEAPKFDQPSAPSPSEDSIPEGVEEPDFFAPERYPVPSPPTVAETLYNLLETDDYNVSLNEAPAPETDQYNVSLNTAPAPATSTDFLLRERKTVSSEPEFQLEAEDYKSQVKAPEPTPSKEVILPETTKSSAEAEREADDDYNSPIKTSVPAPSTAIPSTERDTENTQVAPSVIAFDEEVGETPAPYPSNLPSKAEDANNDYNPITENPESIPSNSSTIPQGNNSLIGTPQSTTTEESTSPEEDTKYSQDVDIPPMSSNPSVMPYIYTAEAETVDIVYEKPEGGWGSWAGGESNGKQVAGVMVGVCIICLAGLVYNSKNKKKTQLSYQPLCKGL